MILRTIDGFKRDRIEKGFFEFCNNKQMITFESIRRLNSVRNYFSASNYLKAINVKVSQNINNECGVV